MSAFEDRVFELLTILKPERLTRIVDIGAHPIHKPPYRGLFDLGACEVWGFEPQRDAYDRLMAGKGEREHYQPYVIGDGSDTKLYLCRSEGFTSTLRPNPETLAFLNRWQNAMTVVAEETFASKRLDDLVDIPDADMIKIDVQGGEKTVFENARRHLNHAVAVITEVSFVPLYRDQPLYHHQAAVLEQSDFFLHKFMSMEKKCISSPLMQPLEWRKHQNQNIDGDAVFVKNLSDASRYSDERLKHLAICADAVIGSFDLALKCLHLLTERGAISETATAPYVKLLPHQRA